MLSSLLYTSPLSRIRVPQILQPYLRALSTANMPNSIPNDIYQYSLHSAHSSGLRTGGPPVAFLTNHGTYGYGFFADSSPMLQIERTAYRFTSSGKAEKADESEQMPFVMVCVFQPEKRLSLETGHSSMATIRELFKSSEDGQCNVPMPFAVRGAFTKVKTEHEEFTNVQGTIFGFAVPTWLGSISGGWDGEGNGLRCAFLSGDQMRGGAVLDFECVTTGTFLEFAKMGRFHLGMPFGKEAGNFETMELA